MDQQPAASAALDLDDALRGAGPLDRSTALGLLERGQDLLTSGDFEPAAEHFRRVAVIDDAPVAAAAMLGLGEALYRLDREPEAVTAWESILALPETPSTYAAWRNVAAARVRVGDLRAATVAYREAERRAPTADRAEIASRLGWLAKETGDARGARRYFAQSRGDGPAVPLAYLVLGLTVIVSFYALSTDGIAAYEGLALNKADLAGGDLYRLLSPALVHANLLHLAVNMYALYLIGPLVETIWGSVTFGLFYLLTAAAASTASFVFTPADSVGASGAIFGLVGVLIAGTRVHNPVLDRRARAIVPQLGGFVVLNLALGFVFSGAIDNAAHVGGLVAGLWLGLFVPPGRARTLRSLWQSGAPGAAGIGPMLAAFVGIAALLAVIVGGLVAGGVRLA